MSTLFIGQVAQLSGCSPKAIRLYESLGLLGKVVRRGAYRVYGDQQLRQVQLIRQAQALGFRLADLEPVLGTRAGGPDWLRLLDQISVRRHAVQAQAEDLRQQDLQLSAVHEEIRQCLVAVHAAPEAETKAEASGYCGSVDPSS